MSLLVRSRPARLAASRPATALRSLATHARPAPAKNYPSITPPYQHLLSQLALTRQILNRPLTLAEKIVYSHLDNVEEGLSGGDPVRGEKYLKLRPDRVAMQGERGGGGILQGNEYELIQLLVLVQMLRRRWLCCNSPLATDQQPPSQLRFTATT
jgi:hypothetical protein